MKNMMSIPQFVSFPLTMILSHQGRGKSLSERRTDGILEDEA